MLYISFCLISFLLLLKVLITSFSHFLFRDWVLELEITSRTNSPMTSHSWWLIFTLLFLKWCFWLLKLYIILNFVFVMYVDLSLIIQLDLSYLIEQKSLELGLGPLAPLSPFLLRYICVRSFHTTYVILTLGKTLSRLLHSLLLVQ